jgi:hypothetical protein
MTRLQKLSKAVGISALAFGLISSLIWGSVFGAITLAEANVSEDFGMGARSAGLAGATGAWDFDGYATTINPALLPMGGHDSARPDARIILSYGLIYMDPNFKSIDNVVTDNTYTSGATTPTYGNVDTSYRHTLGQEIGVTFKAFPEACKLTFGVSMFFPLDNLAYVDTGFSIEPEYFMYRDRDQQPQVDFGAGAELFPGFRFGIGLHTAYSITGDAQATLSTTAGTNSLARFSASLSPKLVPYFGLNYSTSDNFSLAAVVRLSSSSDNTININSAAGTGFAGYIPVNFLSTATLIYEPLSFELSSSFKTSDDWRTYAEVDYDLWSKFVAPGLVIQNATTNPGVNISSGPDYGYGFRNIVVPRVAEEWTVGATKYRFGYAYRPSILKNNPPNGAGNYLDPDKHMFNAGASLEFQRFLGYDTPWRLDLNATYQLLVTETIMKTPGDEAGNASDPKIGAPGYDAGGSVWGGGASLTFAF